MNNTPLQENQEQDQEEFYKPVKKISGVENIIVHTNGSKLSKNSINKTSNKDNNEIFAIYTNGNREEPSESFYVERKDVLQHINDICQDELDSKDIPIPKTISPPVESRKIDLNNYYDEENDDDEMEEFEDEEEDYISNQLFNVKVNVNSQNDNPKKRTLLALKVKI